MTDAAARARASTDLGVSMALNAGAGSGKTSVLTERIVRLLLSGTVQPRELAAITFTEKAAGEILSRVRDALEQRLHTATDASTRATLDAVLGHFGDLTLTTIHAFCKQLLTLESLEADFAPDSDVGADDIAASLMARAVDRWLTTLRSSRPALWRLVERTTTERALHNAARDLERYRELHDVVSAEPFHPDEARTQLLTILAELNAARAPCTDPDDKLLTHHAGMIGEVEALAHSFNADTLTALLLVEMKPRKTLGRAPAWGGADNKARYVNAVVALAAWRTRWRERAHAEVIGSLRQHILPAYDDARGAASIATFDDLLREAARLLRRSPEARLRLAQRFKVLLVDEVQDTDPVQAEVSTLLTRAHHDELPWRQSTPVDARLFVVGDPKQSIYRFRGADVETFKHLQSVVQRNGTLDVLTQNFRSVPGIVQWVNHVFFDLLDYTPQVAHRAPASLDPVVLLQATPEVGEIESAVRHLKDLLASGAQVYDRATRHLRPLALRDVMFLLPAWASAETIAERLRSVGIDCVVEGGDTFFHRDEVRLGIAALRCIVEPADTEAVVFLLRSVFGLSHEQLAAHVAPRADGTRGSFRFTLPNPPPGPVADALAVLLKLHRGRGARSLSALLDELFAHTNVLAVWKLLPDGASRLANLDKLKSMIRDAESTTTSPFAAVEELRRQERSVKDKDIDRIDDDGDAVRITSLFKAKGLEAPVVFVLMAARKIYPKRCLVDHAANTMALKLGELEPPGWKERADHEKELELAERRRWMYVAATRARDQLVICRPHLESKPRGTNDDDDDDAGATEKHRPNDLLKLDIHPRGLPSPAACEHDVVLPLGPSPTAPTVRVRRGDQLPPAEPSQETFPQRDTEVDALLAAPPATSDPDGDAFLAQRRTALRAATRGCVRWRQASGEPGETGWKPGSAVDEAPREERVGARGGRVIHSVMERLDLSRPHDECAARAVELVRLLGVQAALPDDMIDKCATIVVRILKNPLVQKARAAPERWHEVPFTFSPRAGTVVSGTIDLAFPVDAARKEWIVFDWKSRVPAPGDKLRQRYVEQLGRYADALVNSLGDARVIEKEIVGPYPELGDVGGVDDAFEDVHGSLRAPLADLVQRGAPLPRVGVELEIDGGLPLLAAPLEAELAWDEPKVAVFVDVSAEQRQALQTAGWRIFAAIDEELARALGMEPVGGEDA